MVGRNRPPAIFYAAEKPVGNLSTSQGPAPVLSPPYAVGVDSSFELSTGKNAGAAGRRGRRVLTGANADNRTARPRRARGTDYLTGEGETATIVVPFKGQTGLRRRQ
jgi:hypothetical protein